MNDSLEIHINLRQDIMATRRARLQIKPNLGPKDLTKQVNKSISSPVTVLKDDSSTPVGLRNENQNIPDTPDVLALDSPRQSFIESEKITLSERNEYKETNSSDLPEGCVIKTGSLDVGVECSKSLNDCNDSSTEEINCLISESKNEIANEQIKEKNEHLKLEHSKTDINGSGIAVRARFRRFGKVNIPSLKSNAKESKTFENTSNKIPVDKTDQNSGSPAVISYSAQASPSKDLNSHLNESEVSNKSVDQVDASDMKNELETFVAESGKVTSQSQLQNTDTVNSSKISDDVAFQSIQDDLPQGYETQNIVEITEKPVSEIVLEKPSVGQEPESEISAGVTMQEFPKVNVINTRPRIRMPKVKPNLSDTVRRPNRNLVADKTAEQNEASVLEASTKLSSIKEKENESVTPSQFQIMTPSPTPLQPLPQTMTSCPTPLQLNTEMMIPTPVPLQLMSPVNRSPVKHWTPVLNQSPLKNLVDKRIKTDSTSEPPLKKRKQPVIVAPIDQPPDKTKMRMKDMIYWNPSLNPMKAKEKAKADVKEKDIKKEKKVAKLIEEEDGVEDALMCEDSNGSSALPVPQVTVGPDGSIIINEKSLIVSQKDESPREEPEVIDETDVFTTYHSYRKQNRSKSWSTKETAKFYKALGLVGIDFFLIGKLFPNRKHFELKKKFLKEERTNKLLIDKVLKEGGRFNMAVFEQLDADVREEVKEKNQRKQKKEIPKERNIKKEPKKEKEEKKPKRKTRAKRKISKNINYFEDSDSEIEEARAARNKSQTKETAISNTDGELLEILMTMREERIHLSDRESGVSSQPKVIVEPNQGSSATFLINSSQVNMTNQIDSQQGQNLTDTHYNSNSQSGTNQLKFMTISPETGEQINFEPEPQTIHLMNSANTDEGSSMTAGNSGQGIAQQVTPDNIGTTTQGLPQIVSTSLPGSSPTIQLPLEIFNVQNGEDQFVLVTVIPENGEPGETVIHVYRLQGGNNVPQAPVSNL